MGKSINISIVLVAIAVAFVLLCHNSLLFLAYVGVLPLALVMMWLIRKHNRKKPVVTERGPKVQKVRKSFWKALLIAVVSPIGILLFGVLTYLEYVGNWLLWGILILWFVFIVALFRISWLLLFSRSRTKFPRWSIIAGVTTTLCLLASISLTVFGPTMMYLGTEDLIGKGLAPPGTFKVSHEAKIIFRDSEHSVIHERYEIRPTGYYSLVGIEQIESGEIPKDRVKLQEKFLEGTFQGAALEGMHTQFKRDLILETESIGLMRSKFTFSLPGINLLAVDVSSLSPSQPEGSAAPIAVSLPMSRTATIESKLVIDMPKNSFLNSYPKADVTWLPDRDVITLSLRDFPPNIEIYYLRNLRLAVVRVFLSKSSNYDIMLKWLAWIFWPVVVILIGTFNQKLADRILLFLSSPFRRKGWPIGFKP